MKIYYIIPKTKKQNMIKTIIPILFLTNFLVASTVELKVDTPKTDEKSISKAKETKQDIFKMTIMPCKQESSNFLEKDKKANSQSKQDCSFATN